MSLQEEVREAAAELCTIAAEYFAINEDALDIWKKADAAGIHLHDLPSLALYVKESHGAWYDCARFGPYATSDYDDDNLDDRDKAFKLKEKLKEAATHREARQREFLVLADRSRAELHSRLSHDD